MAGLRDWRAGIAFYFLMDGQGIGHSVLLDYRILGEFVFLFLPDWRGFFFWGGNGEVAGLSIFLRVLLAE